MRLLKINFFITLLLTLFSCQSNDFDSDKLEESLNRLIAGFDGDVTVYVKHLKSNYTFEHRSDELFPTASMIKIPIMLGIYDQIEKGALNYHQKQIYRDSLLYPGEDILGGFGDGSSISLNKIVFLMITTSDNTASLWSQSLAGGGGRINAWLDQKGFKHTRVNSRTEGREKDYAKYGWGQTTSKEMSHLLIGLRNRNLISPAADDDMYRMLGNAYWDGEALSEIPPYVQAIAKTGAVSHSRSETVLVNGSKGDYVFTVITKHQGNKNWNYDNDGFVLLREISALLWKHFEPESNWSPAEGHQDFAK